MLNTELIPATTDRVLRGLALRTQTAGVDAFIAAPAQIDNGDEARYADKSGTYTKGVLQSGIGLVDLAAYQTFKDALSSGAPADLRKSSLAGHARSMVRKAVWHFIWIAWTEVRSRYRPHPRSRAKRTQRNL
jgi:hypothetical protein